jgi:hypothetical protein
MLQTGRIKSEAIDALPIAGKSPPAAGDESTLAAAPAAGGIMTALLS